MKWIRLMCLVAVAGQLVRSGAAADRTPTNPESNSSSLQLPPVLRSSEPPDSTQITLPGPPQAASPLKKITAVPPVATPAPLPKELNATFRLPLSRPVVAPATLKTDPLLEIGHEVAAYCQKQIGHWKESDARKLLGEPKRHRPAYDEKKIVNGTIYAFTDPSNKYKELELPVGLSAYRLRLSPATQLAGMPPPVEWSRRRCRCRPGPQILFLHQSPSGRAGRPGGPGHQSRLVLREKAGNPCGGPHVPSIGYSSPALWAYSVGIRSLRAMKLHFRVSVAILAVCSLLPMGAFAGDKKKDDPEEIGNRDVGKGVNFYSLEKEIALGKQLAQEVERQAKIIDDPIIAEYVNRVGQNLVRNSDAKVPFTIKVLDSEE